MIIHTQQVKDYTLNVHVMAGRRLESAKLRVDVINHANELVHVSDELDSQTDACICVRELKRAIQEGYVWNYQQ